MRRGGALANPAQGGHVISYPGGRRGTLRTSQGSEVPVQGYERGDEVVLRLLTRPPGALRDADLAPAVLEYASSRGVVRLEGAGHLEDSTLVRFRAERDAEIIQRRAYVRVTTPQPVVVAALPDPLHLSTIDLSGGGMLLSGAPVLQVGDMVTCIVQLGQGEEPLTGIARIVRAHPDGRRALAFEQILEVDRQRLIHFIFSQLRVGRAKTRGDLI